MLYGYDYQKGKSDSQYFASLPANDLSRVLLNKAQSFFNVLRSNAYIEKIRKMWRAYHGAYNDDMGYGHQINFTGEQGEMVSLPVNHFRNIAEHMYVMITSNRPVMEARAVNTDYKSMAQTLLANGILDYYMREKHLEKALMRAAKFAIVMGSGFVKLEWNATAGDEYDVNEETGEFNYEGELEFSNLTPLDVVFDGTKENWNHDWIMSRTFKNRFDLMAKYPEMADKIRALQPKSDSQVYRLSIWSNDDTDDVPVYEFFHRRTESMPDGRYMLFLEQDIVLIDAKMPYRVIPIFRIAPDDILGTPYGYTPMFDIFPIQEGLNSLYSTIMTNQNAFGVQNIYVPRGADIAINSLEGAMNIIEGNAPPQALNLTQTPKEIFEFVNMLIQAAETISGVNSVARGNPEASLKSGTALALVQAMALQFVSGLQQSYVMLVEDVGTALIQILKDFATTPKIVALVGRNNRPLLKEFTGEDINSINRVVVDIGNPLSRTIAGRVQMAEQLLQMHLLSSPQQYIQIMNTGRLDSGFEGEESELLLIKSENECMLAGEPVKASAIDQHKLHIIEHRSVMADPDLRKNQELSNNAWGHIQEHIHLLQTTDPNLLQLIGEQPLSPPGGSPIGPQGPQPGPQSGPQGGPTMKPFPTMMPSGPMPSPGGIPAGGAPQVPPAPPIQAPIPQALNQAMGNVPPALNTRLPNIPKPAKPLQNLPVLANQLLPK